MIISKEAQALAAKKSVKTLTRNLVSVFNKFIRLRDTHPGGGYFICISCGIAKNPRQMNAGHFFPAGTVKCLRFDEHNVNGECVRCNSFDKDGHLIGYETNLVKKIGQEAVDQLKFKAAMEKKVSFHKWTALELAQMILIYTDKVAELEIFSADG